MGSKIRVQGSSPEILTIFSTIIQLETFLNSFGSRRYAEFLQVGIPLCQRFKLPPSTQP